MSKFFLTESMREGGNTAIEVRAWGGAIVEVRAWVSMCMGRYYRGSSTVEVRAWGSTIVEVRTRGSTCAKWKGAPVTVVPHVTASTLQMDSSSPDELHNQTL